MGHSLRLLVALTSSAALVLAFAGQAPASPGAYKILVAHADCGYTPVMLRDQLVAEPGVASVDVFDAEAATPTAAQLFPYDLVVSFDDCGYLDPVSYGDALADFVDAGGAVIQFTFDDTEGAGPKGRWLSGAYPAFISGPHPSPALSTLGEFDAASPLMQGVTAFQSENTSTVTLAPGATRVARWADGRELIAHKGRVVSVSGYVGDYYAGWSGDAGRIAVNAVRFLGRHVLAVSRTGTGGGAVTSDTGGIACGAACSAEYAYVTHVTLSAAPDATSKFGGWAGDCSGTAPTCVVAVDAARSVTATFTRTAAAAALAIRAGRVNINRRTGRGIQRATCRNVPDDRCRVRLSVRASVRTRKNSVPWRESSRSGPPRGPSRAARPAGSRSS